MQVGADQTLTMDAAHAEPVTATVDGVDTEAFSVIAAYEQTARRGPVWSDFAVGVKSGSVFVAPLHRVETGVGAFQVYSAFSLKAPGNGPSPYQYDLIHPLHPDVPAEVNYRLTAAEQAALARIDERFHHLDTPGTTTSSVRYGLSPTGNLLTSNEVWDRAWTLPDQRADYVSPGYLWSEEAVYDNIPGLRYPAVSEEAYHSYLPGSRQEKDWIRQPLRPDWYDDPQPAGGCQPDAPSRTSGNLHISLDNLTDQHQRFSCVGFNSEWTSQTTRTLALYRNGQLVAQKQDSSADFAIPAQAADYRLIYDQDASSILPVSTKVNTAWTFHSAGPAGTESVPLALLSIDYALPLDLSNHPTDGKATLTVRQAHGAATQHVTSLALWVSTDDGTTWTTVPVARTQDGQYTAQLPVLSAGEAMSLRVKAEADGGSGVEQTVIRAYRAG